ncbi:MAG: hypothetical protein ACKVZ0_15615 [Gemmatimonadales bacterium]
MMKRIMLKRTAAALAFLLTLGGCAGITGPDQQGQQGTGPSFGRKAVSPPPPPAPDSTKVVPPETPNGGYAISW